MTSIKPCLWFDNRIDEAVEFYTKTFKNAKVTNITRAAPGQPAFTAEFELEDQKFMALGGNPRFQFTESVSFFVTCADQAEVDHFWNTMTADGGEESQCGWLKDRFGLSWQIVPKQIFETVMGSDRAGAQRAMQAMMGMRKLVVADLQKAYAGGWNRNIGLVVTLGPEGDDHHIYAFYAPEALNSLAISGAWFGFAARAAFRASTHHARLSSISSRQYRDRVIGKALALHEPDELVGIDLHGLAQRHHLQLRRNLSQVFDSPRSARIAVAHIGHALADKFGIDAVT